MNSYLSDGIHLLRTEPFELKRSNYEIDEACDSDTYQESDIEKLRLEQVSEIIRKHPDSYVEKLKDIGFQWFDDEWDEEEEEERAAVPQTENQEALVTFSEEGGPLTQELLDAFETEKRHIIDRQIAELQEPEDKLPSDIPF